MDGRPGGVGSPSTQSSSRWSSPGFCCERGAESVRRALPNQSGACSLFCLVESGIGGDRGASEPFRILSEPRKTFLGRDGRGRKSLEARESGGPRATLRRSEERVHRTVTESAFEKLLQAQILRSSSLRERDDRSAPPAPEGVTSWPRTRPARTWLGPRRIPPDKASRRTSKTAQEGWNGATLGPQLAGRPGGSRGSEET